MRRIAGDQVNHDANLWLHPAWGLHVLPMPLYVLATCPGRPPSSDLGRAPDAPNDKQLQIMAEETIMCFLAADSSAANASNYILLPFYSKQKVKAHNFLKRPTRLVLMLEIVTITSDGSQI